MVIKIQLYMRKLLFTILVLLIFPSICLSTGVNIFFTGKTFGSIAPCTCPINPDGGISRRVKFLGDVKDDNSIFIDTGGMFAGGYGEWFGTLEGEERNRLLKDAYRRIDYAAVIPGLSEFQYSANYLRETISSLGYNFVMANYKGELKLFKDYVIKRVGDQRILIIGVSVPDLKAVSISKEFSADDIGDPIAAVKRVIREKRKKNDLIVVAGFVNNETATALAELKHVDMVLFGMNGILIKKPSMNGDAIKAQSYYNSKKIGKLSLELAAGKIKQWDYSYHRLSPSVGEVADLFNSVMKLENEPAEKTYHVYLVFDSSLPGSGEKDLMKMLQKNAVDFICLFNDPSRENARDFWLLNNSPELFLSGKHSQPKEGVDRIIRQAKKELKNMGDAPHEPGVYTGLRYFPWENFKINEITWDLKVLGVVK